LTGLLEQLLFILFVFPLASFAGSIHFVFQVAS